MKTTLPFFKRQIEISLTSGALCVIASFLFIVFIVYPFIFIQNEYYINGNISWLMICAERLLEGKSMSTSAYETNPPLSIILYMPFVLAGKAFNIPAEMTLLPISLAFIIGCTLMCKKILFHHMSELSNNIKIAFLILYIAALTLGTGTMLYEREHFLTIALIPMVLGQYTLLQGKKLPSMTSWPVFMCGAVFILLKPHYGIIPVTMLAARLIKHKNIKSVLTAPDFLSLCIATSIYAVILLTLFSDYLFIILPDVVNYYYLAPSDTSTVLGNSSFVGLLFFAVLASTYVFRKEIEPSIYKFLMFLNGIGLLSFIPYITQMRGYSYHLIAVNTFLFLSLVLLAISIIMQLSKKINAPEIALTTILLALAALYNYMPPNKEIVTRTQIKALPLAEYLKENCPKGCAAFSFHDDMEVFLPTEFALGYGHGSRFAGNWFFPALYNDTHHTATGQQHSDAKDRYAKYLMEDLEKQKPQLLFLLHETTSLGSFTMEDTTNVHYFVDFFFNTPEMMNRFKNLYHYKETIDIKQDDYFSGYVTDKLTYRFDVYERTHPE